MKPIDIQEDEDNWKPAVPTEHLELVEYLKNYLRQNYHPVSNPRDASSNKSTSEIFLALQSIFPSNSYSIEEVALWMHDAGFTVYDFGGMKLEWLLKEN